MQQRKKPSLPSRTPRRPGETGPRTVTVPRGPNESVPKGSDESVPKEPNEPVPKGPNKSVPEGPNEPVPEEPDEVPLSPGARPDCPIILGRGLIKVAMNSRYYPAIKRSRTSFSTSDDSDGNDENDDNEGNDASFDSHESMESADERDSDSDNDEESTDATKDKEGDSPLDSDLEELVARKRLAVAPRRHVVAPRRHAVAPTRRAVASTRHAVVDFTTPEQSDEDDYDSEELVVKLPVKQPSGIPQGIKAATLTAGEREAILRQELRIPPPTLKKSTNKRIDNFGGPSTASGRAARKFVRTEVPKKPEIQDPKKNQGQDPKKKPGQDLKRKPGQTPVLNPERASKQKVAVKPKKGGE